MAREELYSIKSEKHLLAGLMKYPDLFFEIDQNYTDNIFYIDIHKAIFNVIKNLITKGQIKTTESIDTILVGQKIIDLGIKFNHDIDIIDYLQAINYITINSSAVPNIAEDLEKLKFCRDIARTGEKIISEVNRVGDRKTEDILHEIDKIYHDTVKLKSFKNEPELLMDSSIIEVIEQRAKNPLEEMGLITPYKLFNLKFGGLRDGNVYAFVSRAGEGKSTILSDISIKATKLNKGAKVLILDTEMETQDVRYRRVAALSGISPWWLETGNWINKPELKRKWEATVKLLRSENCPVHHINVAAKPISEVCTLIRRWFYKNVNVAAGEKGIIVYDYIKLTGEVSDSMKEYQLIGEKINTLKELSLELKVPVLTACQLNRAAVMGADDSTAIAQSDRLMWFGTFVAIFRRKRQDELEKYGDGFGTHSLIPLKARFEGREAFGHSDLIRTQDENGRVSYLANYINYNVENFNVDERGDLRDIIRHLEMRGIQNNEPEEPIADF